MLAQIIIELEKALQAAARQPLTLDVVNIEEGVGDNGQPEGQTVWFNVQGERPVRLPAFMDVANLLVANNEELPLELRNQAWAWGQADGTFMLLID